NWQAQIVAPADTANLGTAVVFSVDGTPIDTVAQLAIFSTRTGDGACDVIPCEHSCGTIVTGDPTGPFFGFCNLIPGCGCGSGFSASTSAALLSGQTVTVDLIPLPGT